MTTFNAALPRLLSAAALLACAGLAQAQYMWIDEKGIKQVSDQPPPTSTPKKNVLKAPRGDNGYKIVYAGDAAAAATAAPAAGGDGAATAPAAPKGPPTMAERNAEYKKRAAEKRVADEKAKEEAEAAEWKKDNCDKAVAYKASLDSGERLRETAANGERVYMDDSKRAAEMAKVKEILGGCR